MGRSRSTLELGACLAHLQSCDQPPNIPHQNQEAVILQVQSQESALETAFERRLLFDIRDRNVQLKEILG